MTLPELNLDDRTFQELVNEARHRIMDACPELTGWTEHNVSDPGITLVEVFAWMTDLLIYRLNRVPDKLHLALMELLGITLEPPEPARALIRFWLNDPAEQPVKIPAISTEVATPRTPGEDPVVFQVRDDFVIPALRPDAYVVEHAHDVRYIPLFDGEARPPRDHQKVLERAGDSFYLGFEAPLGRLLVRVDVDCSPAYGVGIRPEQPPLEWSVSESHGRWQAAEVLADTTGGLNYEGSIELQLPRRSGRAPIRAGRFYWLRCRVVRDGYSHPPEIRRITARAIGALVPATHSTREVGEFLGYSDGTAGQTFTLRHAPALPLDPRSEHLEVQYPDSPGWHPWRLRDSFASSGPEDPHFQFDAATGEISLGPAIRNLQHYRSRHVDPRGAHDGDGDDERPAKRPHDRSSRPLRAAHAHWEQHGKVPPKGSTLRMSAYRHGGGHRGNVKAGTLTVLRTSIAGVAGVSNPRDAHSGVDGEPIEVARQRAMLELRTRFRAVTAEDFEFLAHEATARVGRAKCVEPDPGDPIRLYILETSPQPVGPLEYDDLHPSGEVLREVRTYLRPRQLLGAHVSVEAVPLRGIQVEASVKVAAWAEPGRVLTEIPHALDRHLSPLGNPAGKDAAEPWRFGRPVTAGELNGVIHSVEGVELVTRLRIFEVDARTGERLGEAAQGAVTLAPQELVFSARHDIRQAVEEQWSEDSAR